MTDTGDTVTIKIPREAAKWFAAACGVPGRYSGALIDACRAALWTPKVGDMVQTRSGTLWLPILPHEDESGWRRAVVEVTDRHVVLRDTDDGHLGAALIQDVRLDERPEPEGGWDTDWWDEHKADYLDGDDE